ncbi:UNVERIFIED_CONTAM: hypothetical protein FKN15_035939 [Acipenser sinensis]
MLEIVRALEKNLIRHKSVSNLVFPVLLNNEDEVSEPSVSEEPSGSAQTAPPTQTAEQLQSDAPPPPYSSVAAGAAAAPEGDFQNYPVPPPYSVATTLPTYDEAENAKAAAMAAAAADVAPREDDYPPRDDFSDADQMRVGNDGVFMLAFFIFRLFYWILQWSVLAMVDIPCPCPVIALVTVPNDLAILLVEILEHFDVKSKNMGELGLEGESFMKCLRISALP